MGLMFPRVALNFAKNGYYPTDEGTLEGILRRLRPAEHGCLRAYDPCCGEGVALAELGHHLGAETYGIEIDDERATHASSLLDRVIHADLQRTKTDRTAFGLLFLNPPYGNLVSDHTGLSGRKEKRLEELFYQLTVPSLAFGGVMVMLLPVYAYTAAMEERVLRHFRDVRVFRAAVGTYRQVVVFGVRKRTSERTPAIGVGRDKHGAVVDEGVMLPPIDEAEDAHGYVVPASPEPLKQFFTFEVTEDQLAEEVRRSPCLWADFDTTFRVVKSVPKSPLKAPSPWHLSLLLAAGNIHGVIEGAGGRRLLVKGATHKVQAVTTTEADDATITKKLDRFVPQIKAIDLTPGSPDYGAVLTIG